MARAGAPPAALAAVRFGLARALWDGGGDHARAIELARAAGDAHRALGEPGAAALAEVTTWLAARAAR